MIAGLLPDPLAIFFIVIFLAMALVGCGMVVLEAWFAVRDWWESL